LFSNVPTLPRHFAIIRAVAHVPGVVSARICRSNQEVQVLNEQWSNTSSTDNSSLQAEEKRIEGASMDCR
jgi:hypothetical protein